MIPDELLKVAPELAKGATALGAAIPFTGIAKRILGPAADEIAEMWRDQVRVYRYQRELSCLKKAEKMAEDAGFTPKAVPVKLLFPLLEGASFEEDEDLHTMWAALLANAADPATSDNVRPGFIAVLKQLAADEAGLLDRLYSEVHQRQQAAPGTSVEFEFGELLDAYKTVRPPPYEGSEFIICLSGLEAASLIARLNHRVNNEVLPRYVPTPRGHAFFSACTPPKLVK